MDKLLAALERVIGFHHLSDEVEEKIKKGYVIVYIIVNYYDVYSPGGNVEMYLSLMERLHTAVEFFTQSNPGSVELGSVVSGTICIVCSLANRVAVRLPCLKMV